MAQTTVEILSHDVPKSSGFATTFILKTPWYSDEFPKPLRPHTIKLPLWKDGQFCEYVFWNEQVRQGKVPFNLDIYATTTDVPKVTHELVGSGVSNLFDYILDLDPVAFQKPILKLVKVFSNGNNNLIGTISVRITMVLWPSTNKHFQSNRTWLLQQVQLKQTTKEIEQANGCEAHKQNCHPDSASLQKSKVKGKVAFSC